MNYSNGLRHSPHVIVTSRISDYSQSIASSVPFDVFQALDAAAKRHKITKAEIIRQLVTDFVGGRL